MKIYAFMNTIDQGLEIHKHITLERGMDITIHPIYIPFTNLDHWIKLHTNMSCNCANLIKECNACNSGIITLSPIDISTSMNKHKLDLVEAIVGASNVIFLRRMWYSNNTCLTWLLMKIHLIVTFHNIMLPFFPSILPIWRIPSVSWAYG
jgi:hypothetical protein